MAVNEKVKAFQLAWNEKNPNKKLVVDGVEGNKTEQAIKDSGYDNIDSWWSDWDFNKRYNTFSQPIMNGDEEKLKPRRTSETYQAYQAGKEANNSAAYQAYLAGKEAYKRHDDIMKRLAGLPNNVTTWNYTDEPNNDVDGIHFKTDDGYYDVLGQHNNTLGKPVDETVAVEQEITKQREPDWDYRTALIYRIFGDETPMQQYINQKQAERTSRDNAMYNQYLNIQNKREQEAKDREAKRLADEAKSIEKENKKSAFRKSRSDIATSYSSLENELDELKNNGYVSEDEYKQMKEELEKEKPRRQAYDKYSQYSSFANEKQKNDVLNGIANDKSLTDDDKVALTNKLKTITSETAKARQAAIASGAGKQTQTELDAQNAIKNNTPPIKLSQEVKAKVKKTHKWENGRWIKKN